MKVYKFFYQTFTEDLHFVLTDLSENTIYEMYVTAKTQHYESEKSNIITVDIKGELLGKQCYIFIRH